MASIVNRLNELKGDMTITAMAKKVDVGTSTMYRYLNGRVPKADVIARICRAMGVSERWLLTGEGPKWYEPDPLAEDAGREDDRPDLTGVEFYRERISKILRDLDLRDVVDLYFKAEAKRVNKLVDARKVQSAHTET